MGAVERTVSCTAASRCPKQLKKTDHLSRRASTVDGHAGAEREDSVRRLGADLGVLRRGLLLRCIAKRESRASQ